METEYYLVGKDYGWNQEKFLDPLMKIGGFRRRIGDKGCKLRRMAMA